jgi:hypothetical protein
MRRSRAGVALPPLSRRLTCEARAAAPLDEPAVLGCSRLRCLRQRNASGRRRAPACSSGADRAIRGLGTTGVWRSSRAPVASATTLRVIEQALAAGVAAVARRLTRSVLMRQSLGRQLATAGSLQLAAREARDIEPVRAAAIGLRQSYAAFAAALVRGPSATPAPARP